MAAKTARRGPGKARGAPTKRPEARKGSAPSAVRGLADDVFAELVESVREGGRILRGAQVPAREYHVDLDDPDVTEIREQMGLSQTRFAFLLGISPRTLQGWEQGRRTPKGAERTLLRIAAKHPQALLDVVG